jgi:AraC-like DNA-binding protein
MSYRPIQDGIDKKVRSVLYTEEKPPAHLAQFVHVYWELKTIKPIPADFLYHIVPDACVNVLFDQINAKVAAITAIQTKAITLNLGKKFHFIGVQLIPGVWQNRAEEIKSGLVTGSYEGSLGLDDINSKLVKFDFLEKQKILTQMVEQFVDRKLIAPNPVVAKILANIGTLNTVSEMAEMTNMSTRHLQRTIKQTTGFSPHDFLKVLRLQQSFRQDYLSYYADQSHFIHSFRKVTGYTPTKFKKKFNV